MHSLKSSLKVKAIIRSAQSSNLFATILRSGDKDNGIILLKLRRKDNKSILLGKVLTVDGFYKWNDLFYNENNWIDEIDVDKRIKKEIGFDPDIWILEIETENFWHPLEDKIYK